MELTNKPRVVLKLSGQAFRDDTSRSAITQAGVNFTANQIRSVADLAELIVIVGGGNIIRGRDFPRGHHRSQETIDQIGMLATILNGQALAEFLYEMGVPAIVLNKFEPALPGLTHYQPGIAVESCQSNQVVIVVGGTGKGGVSTDTAAVRVAVECRATKILKGTNVDGVFPTDPNRTTSQRHFCRLTIEEFKKLVIEKIFDQVALDELRSARLSCCIFNWFSGANLAGLLKGEPLGTLII